MKEYFLLVSRSLSLVSLRNLYNCFQEDKHHLTAKKEK